MAGAVTSDVSSWFNQIEDAVKAPSFPRHLEAAQAFKPQDYFKLTDSALSNASIRFNGETISGLKDKIAALSSDAPVSEFLAGYSNLRELLDAAGVDASVPTEKTIAGSISTVKKILSGNEQGTAAEQGTALKVSLYLYASGLTTAQPKSGLNLIGIDPQLVSVGSALLGSLATTSMAHTQARSQRAAPANPLSGGAAQPAPKPKPLTTKTVVTSERKVRVFGIPCMSESCTTTTVTTIEQ